VVEPNVLVHVDENFHTKIPLLTLADLAHFGIPLGLPMRGRVGCGE
jgi:hypothetical protein